MTNTNAPVYNSLHFREYLDGGLFRLPPTSLQLPLPKDTSDTNVFADIRKVQLAYPPHPPTTIEDQILVTNYSHICEQHLQCKVIAADFPGGRQRSSFRLHLDNGHTAIASRRFDSGRARLEYRMMQALKASNAPVPKCFAFNGMVLIQEDLPGIRLSEALKNATREQYTQWLSLALDALAQIQQIATQQSLQHELPIVGCEPDWLIALIDRTALLGNHTKLPCPLVPVATIYERLVLLKPCFTKWDARPGNAMLEDNAQVRWFDWEHCCARNPMDDMAWLLCDDAVPEYPEEEEQLIHTYLETFADGRNPEHAMAYLSIFGTHHTCIRICRLLDEKAYDSWQAFEQRVNAIPGTLLPITQQLCAKASRWAAKSPETAMLQEWFLAVRERIAEM
ncbi:MAG: phosphotransferase [Thiolinea sp.]